MREIRTRYAGLHPGRKGLVRFKNMFSSAPPPPPPPVPPPPMPDPNSPAVIAAQRAAMQRAMGFGRTAAVLTQQGGAGTIAGGAAAPYSGAKLG